MKLIHVIFDASFVNEVIYDLDYIRFRSTPHDDNFIAETCVEYDKYSFSVKEQKII